MRHCVTNQKVEGSIPDEVMGGFFIDLIVTAALWPGFDSARNTLRPPLPQGVKAAGA